MIGPSRARGWVNEAYAEHVVLSEPHAKCAVVDHHLVAKEWDSATINGRPLLAVPAAIRVRALGLDHPPVELPSLRWDAEHSR